MNTIEKLGEDGFPVYGSDFKLLEGLRIGKLTVRKRVERPANVKSGIWWECVCDCGAVVVKRSDNLKAGATRGGSAAQKNKGCRTCGSEKCNGSGIKNRNTNGMIKSSHTNSNLGGAKIIEHTGFIDESNRSEIVMCKCTACGQPFPTTKRSQSTTCGCTSGKPVRSFSDYIAQRGCKSKGEWAIYNLLVKHKMTFIQEKKFDDLMDKARLPFDFYVLTPKGPYIIEYDGEQHFRETSYFGSFRNTRKHYLMKNQYCFKNNIPIIRIPYDVEPKIEDITLATSKYILTKENQKEYYNGRTNSN